MGPIFDYDLNNEVKLDDSRVSGKSLTCNKVHKLLERKMNQMLC
jgi:hypothetical protein